MGRPLLCIDDSEDNVEMLRRFLARRSSVELIAAATGKAGIELAAADQPGLILLDRHLPDGLGEDVLRALKSNAATAGIPVIILSGDSGRELTAELQALGAIDLISKPYDIRDVLQIIETYCA